MGGDDENCNKEPRNREGRSIFLSILHNKFVLPLNYVKNIVMSEVDVIQIAPGYVRVNVPGNVMFIYLKESVRKK